MIKNYFKIFWRNLKKYRLYSFINIAGLSLGITCFIVIFIYVKQEHSFDQYYNNSDLIYRAYQRNQGDFYLGSDRYAYTSMAMASAIVDDFPEIESGTTIRDEKALIAYKGNSFYEEGIWADVHFFNVFHHPLIQGNHESVLKEANSIILDESTSQKIFGKENPIGQIITFQNEFEFTVTGIMEDLPSNTTLKYHFVASILSNRQYASDIKDDRWGNNDYYTFFTLANEANVSSLESKFPNLVEKYINRRENYKFKDSFHFQPLSDLHFENNMNFDFGIKGSKTYTYMFSIIGILVLLLACTNYMNLSIARSMKRSGEVAVRKVIGADRRQIIIQFLSESILFAFIAFLFGLGLSYLIAPMFGELMDRTLNLHLLFSKNIFSSLLFLVFVVGVISGSYPAVLISSYKPVQIFKRKLNRFSGKNLQRVLTIGQYAISIFLVSSSLVIYLQFQFIHDKELGFDTEQVITISVSDRNLGNYIQELKNEWLTNPNIVSATTASELPTNVTSGTMVHHIHQTRKEAFNIYRARVGHDYLDVFDINLVAGRTFIEGNSIDSTDSRVINSSAARRLGWTPDEAIGKTIGNGNTTRIIIGVVNDFHMHSMHLPIGAMMFELGRGNRFEYIGIKLGPGSLSETITYLKNSIKAYSPFPFHYEFLDDRFNELYKADIHAGKIFGLFTLLSILLASLGLFGMATYVAEQRTQEIGIRKTLGASVLNIMNLLSKDFLKMVVLGFVIAVPIAWYVMNGWLQKYAYRVELEWWMFLVAGFIALMIALISTSSQAIRAAILNPIESLRTE